MGRGYSPGVGARVGLRAGAIQRSPGTFLLYALYGASVAGVRSANPYRPGFNQPPGVLAGRDEVLDAAREALAVAALDRRTPRPLVIVGSRGVGKTVLLGEIATVAGDEHGWITVHVEVRPKVAFLDQLTERLDAARDLLREAPSTPRFRVKTVGGRVGGFGVSAELDLTRRAERDQPADLALERSLAGAVAAATEHHSGLVITIDELQLARRRELGQVAATLQQHVPDHWPLVVAVAGLPTIRNPDRSVTYLERGEWHELGLLDRQDTLLALTGPAAGAGRPLEPDAAELLAEASGGYPYAVQVMGHHAWRCSTGAATITAAHAAHALPRADRDLTAGLYASRWEDASPKEREYLHAIAQLTLAGGGEPTGREVADRLGVSTREVSYLRDRLLKKGTLVVIAGRLHFPVPGMARWVAEHGA